MVADMKSDPTVNINFDSQNCPICLVSVIRRYASN